MENETQPVAEVKKEVAVNPIREFFADPNVEAKFKSILGAKSVAFVTSVLQIANSDDRLRMATPKSIFNAAATAATMDLPVNRNLGFSWIIGYKNNGVMEAQFQMGYKGYVQLAMRTGQYLRLNCILVYENQFTSWNELTEELVADFGIMGVGKVLGVCGYFKLLNGFEKTVYWQDAKVIKHAQKYSKNYNGYGSIWKEDPDEMKKKTVLKNMLSKWGILSVEMQRAMVVDQAVVRDFETQDVDYVDGTSDEPDTSKENEQSNKATQETLQMMKEAANKSKGKK